MWHKISESVLEALGGRLLVNFGSRVKVFFYGKMVSPRPSRTVVGIWKGHEVQGMGEVKKQLHVKLELRGGTRQRGEYTVGQQDQFCFDVSGHFVDGKVLQLTYVAKNVNAVRLGAMTLVLSDEGNDLVGHAAGYSAKLQETTTAQIRLKRV